MVWRECKDPADWCDAVLVPIPKKGDLSSCDKWRGIALLDVVGKVVQECSKGDCRRLQRISFLNHNVDSGREEGAQT